MKASELIEALEDGQYVGRDVFGDGHHWVYLCLNPGNAPSLEVGGWGSSLGTRADRLKHLLEHPEQWVIGTRDLDNKEFRAKFHPTAKVTA